MAIAAGCSVDGSSSVFNVGGADLPHYYSQTRRYVLTAENPTKGGHLSRFDVWDIVFSPGESGRRISICGRRTLGRVFILLPFVYCRKRFEKKVLQLFLVEGATVRIKAGNSCLPPPPPEEPRKELLLLLAGRERGGRVFPPVSSSLSSSRSAPFIRKWSAFSRWRRLGRSINVFQAAAASKGNLHSLSGPQFY